MIAEDFSKLLETIKISTNEEIIKILEKIYQTGLQDGYNAFTNFEEECK